MVFQPPSPFPSVDVLSVFASWRDTPFRISALEIMSLALIQESAKEVRRLAVAGSPLAVGDFRMKKLIAPLEQAGAKVPVFAQVAKAISDLVNGTEAESAARLLALSTLLNAILYTQGQTGAGGELSEFELFPAKCSSTRTSARALKPLIAALTSAGGGRLSTLKSGLDRGAFNDLRLIDPAIQALGDSFPEIADLVTDKILPGYGPGIVPRLKTGLELKGKKQDARRLRVMHHLAPDATLELCKAALDQGSPEVKAAAIGCLGKHEECLPLVLEQANSKNKTLRAAALEALAEYDREEVTSLFEKLLKGDSLDLLARPFRSMKSRQVLAALFAEGKRVFDLLLKGEQDLMPRYSEVLACLKGRKDSVTEEFLLGCFAQCEKLVKLKPSSASKFTSNVAGVDLMDELAWLLYDAGSPKALDAVLAKRNALSSRAFNYVLRSALRIWPADKIFEEFSPLLEQKKGTGKEKSEVLQHTIRTTSRSYVSEPFEIEELEGADAENPEQVQWDPRWLDAAIKADHQLIVCCLARPGHQASIEYLLKANQAKAPAQSGLVIRALARCQYPKVTDVFLETVAKKAKGAQHYYELHLLLESARYLPPADLPKLDAFAATLDEKFVDKYLEALAPLRTPTKPEQTP